jgi:hypothetical protein
MMHFPMRDLVVASQREGDSEELGCAGSVGGAVWVELCRIIGRRGSWVREGRSGGICGGMARG